MTRLSSKMTSLSRSAWRICADANYELVYVSAYREFLYSCYCVPTNVYWVFPLFFSYPDEVSDIAGPFLYVL